MNNISPQELPFLARKNTLSTVALFDRLKKRKPGNLDTIVRQIHDEIFSEFDCLECANCCKSISPRITDKDIERFAHDLKIRPSEVVQKFLVIDEDSDYVFKSAPCPFLMPDNYCTLYKNRPKACREYPHTDRKRFYGLIDLTLKNYYICPAVYLIVEKMKQIKI